MDMAVWFACTEHFNVAGSFSDTKISGALTD